MSVDYEKFEVLSNISKVLIEKDLEELLDKMLEVAKSISDDLDKSEVG